MLHPAPLLVCSSMRTTNLTENLLREDVLLVLTFKVRNYTLPTRTSSIQLLDSLLTHNGINQFIK